MKSSKAKRPAPAAVVAPPPKSRIWVFPLALCVSLWVLLQVYWPAMNGPFLLDDTYLPYMLPDLHDAPLRTWLQGLRPLLMFSYWLNFNKQAVNQDTLGYHMVNVLLH